MHKLIISLLIFILIGCQQQASNTPSDVVKSIQDASNTASNVVKSIQEVKLPEITQPIFNCIEHKDSLKEADPNIQVAQNIREINEREKQILNYSSKMGGKDVSKGYVLDQKVPGTIQGICVAEVFFADGANHNIIFTISDVDGSEYIAYQDYETLAALAIVMSLSQPTIQQEQKPVEPKTIEQPVVTSQVTLKDTITNLEVVKQEAPAAIYDLPETKITPSFNCDKASTIIEKTICSSSELAKLDNSVALAYKNALSNGTHTDLKTTQKKWIKSRNSCQTEKCIEKAYVERWEDLAPWDFEQHD